MNETERSAAHLAELGRILDKYGIGGRRKPTRRQIEITLDVLSWLSSGDQDPAVKDDIAGIRMLLDLLLETGW